VANPASAKMCGWKARLRASHDGFCHGNYFFTIGGRDLVLRLAKRFRSLRTVEETLELLAREAETLPCAEAGLHLAYDEGRLAESILPVQNLL
jgi:hypothetical protein